MVSLKDMCEMVDDFVSDGTSPRIEGASEFWKLLNKDGSAAQLYAECLIYKYIALSYGLGGKPLFQSLSQIKNISAETGGTDSGNSTPATSPRGSLTPSGKSKRGSGNFDPAEHKSTPKKKFNIGRRKSEENKKSKKELTVEHADFRRKSKNSGKLSPSSETPDSIGNSQKERHPGLDSVLLSLTYVSKMCDLTRWDFTKLRDVFLTWNKARGWEQTASDYEYSVMKKFSMIPTGNVYGEEQVKKNISEVLQSVNKVPDEISVSDTRNVGESIKYWEIRHKILTRPEEAESVINCLIVLAKKILDDGDETKILPLLHILCETIIMSPHVPLELLQECYSIFAQFYVWPSYVAHPVKEVLDMIQLEMKCPGHFYRMIFFQDNEIPLSPHLAAKMPCSETHVFIDEEIPDKEALSQAFRKLRESRASSSKLASGTGTYRFIIRHIFEAVFGAGCCDLATLENALQDIPENDTKDLCQEALAIMEEASMKETHAQAQDFLRADLEIFSEKLTGFLEGESVDDSDASGDGGSPKIKPPSFRRVSVLYDTCRTRDSTGSPMRASFSAGQIGTPSPRRNNSYLRRNTSGSLDNPLGARKLVSKANAMAKETPAELLGSKVSTISFSHDDLSETLYELVRNTSREFVQEKKRSARFSFTRKRDAAHLNEQDAYRDSGVIDDEETDMTKNITTAVQHLRIDETEEEDPKSNDKTKLSTSSSTDDSEASSSKHESDEFWKEFMAKGFDSENDDLSELMKTMSSDQRKSFILENSMKKLSVEKKTVIVPISLSPPQSPAIVIEPESPEIAQNVTDIPPIPDKPDATSPVQEPVIMRRQSTKTDRKRMNRLSRLVRSKKRSSRKGKSDGDLDKISSAESLSSISSTPSSTTSDDLSDTQSLRIRTTSDPVFRQKKRAKWARGSGPGSSPLVQRNKRNTLSIDVTPRSPFNLSVRSLPARDRASILTSDIFETKENTHPLSPTKEEGSSIHTTPTRASFQFGDEDDDEIRRRIDSGIGHESSQDTVRRRTTSSFSYQKEQEDHGIGGVKFALKEVQKANRRHRMSVSDDLEERTVQKKVLKIVFVGNDKTVGHMARAYYDLRKRQMSRAPLLQHVDLRLFFIPVSSITSSDADKSTNADPALCDISVGELLGTYDSWYHTVVTLSVNNLLRIYPKINSLDDMKESNSVPSTPEKQLPAHKFLAPHEVIASSLLSYSRFAVSRTDISMYKIAMVSSTGDVFTDIFCCQLKIGHEAYTTAAKAGRFGKLGKLVDLSDDNGPPPAYTQIEYSKWSIDGRLIRTGQMPETFYHTVCVTPMSLCKNHFRGTDVLQLVVIDNEKRQKVVRRTSSNKLSSMEEAEVAGNILDIGTMKMEVTRPTQGTFALVLDNSKIYTSVKSIEVVPCCSPEAETTQNRIRNVASRHLREHQLIRLPLRTFWPATN